MRLFTKIFRRRRQWYAKGLISNSKHRIRYLLLLVVVIILIHSFAMVIFEGLTIGDALWLSLTTINTTGYGDLSSTSFLGRSATVLLMYILGITVMAQAATEFIEYKLEQKDQKIKGHWNWNTMKNHIVIIHTPKLNPKLYLERLVSQIKKTPSLSERPICIVTERFAEGLPLTLREQNVVHVHGEGRDEVALNNANVSEASKIILLSSDSANSASDSIVLDVLLHFQELNLDAFIVAEAVKDTNRERFLNLGVNSVLRPIRAYPELIVRTLEAPGTEKLLENLFSLEGDRAIRFDYEFATEKWSDIACRVMHKGLGTLVGYVDENDKVWTNPPPFKPAKGKALLLLVHHKHIPSHEQLVSSVSSEV
ncbi:potassium channel protein [Aliikangiella coralliicola]|uniref:Potassium channel protein n=1 Tax=Aliikangiella coralliicola TaxID=2592383 RepID=A0A545UGE9_9GAMM|nr:potassium channel family protein [Aliikangiella coralliicola]TQV88515.1 potassium channel protein [Aliikangiella coralliicola]